MIRKLLSKSSLFHCVYLWIVGKGVSPLKTLYFNLVAFRVGDALKFPVWIYQGVKIEEVGKIKISTSISSGIVRIGQPMFYRGTKTTFINRGTIVFDGNCKIMMGSTIHVLTPSATLILGREVMICELVKILCDTTINIGDFTRIAYGSTVIDSEFHYVLNIENGEVNAKRKPITIGKFNWIGNSSIIKKGVRTPDYCIVSNGSMLIKDYSELPLYSLLMGAPAKLRGSGFRRVYNDGNDHKLDEYFKENLNKYSIGDINHEQFCSGVIHVHDH